ncbi:(S)-ureidoglycine aminohydrolase [Orbus hercynius]|uniref:(S)-ureidoglycine aminohydrolase n=1 Tax=Orbus hercynius TaxID=593135 RepID=A0A495RJE9_9GAMM|nr:(S)-ureidoglycine aminohydrolase [Orbus hercynius]RKS87461.1 (S)-ureidoglycine aminohydrolase [Orbus hercynius]
MGYLNNNTGYPKDLLASRAVIKKDNYALIPPDGLVKNVIPGFDNCDITILATPKLGASFVDYIVTMNQGGENRQGFGGEGIEIFVYVIEGDVKASADTQHFDLTCGGFLYCPPGVKLYLKNNTTTSKLFLYKRRYQPLAGHKPYVVSNNVNNLPKIDYEGMTDVAVQDFLPKELAFDMNFHILTFKPGASHGYIETHVQEHGAYLLSGEGMYVLDNDWIPVKKDDYIFMAAYALQACYAVGHESLSYIYSKDCHRDVEL